MAPASAEGGCVRVNPEISAMRQRLSPRVLRHAPLRTVRRAGWGVADQAASSLTNFGAGIFVARSVSPQAFGAFSLAFATYLVAMNVVRSLASEPLVVRYSAAPRPQWREATKAATGTAIVTSVILGVGCVLVAATVGGSLREALLAL